MSHTSTIRSIKITSVTALRAAVAELQDKGVKVSLLENAVPRGFYANQAGMGTADFVLKLADSRYDVGLYKAEDGSYEARTDFFGGLVENVLGAKACTPESREQARLGRLFQLYGVHAAMETARKKGHTVMRRQHEDGKITLEITGAGL